MDRIEKLKTIRDSFVFYCKNCGQMVSVNCEDCKDTKTKKDYTDIVCADCAYIITTIEPKKQEG